MADDDKGDEVWEENWEDDNIEDDFTLQLRAELEKKVILHLPWVVKFEFRDWGQKFWIS